MCLYICMCPGDVFWSDVSARKIFLSQCLNSSSVCTSEPLVSDLIDTVDGIAVDPVNQILYWTDAGRRLIEAIKIPAGPRTVLVWNDLDSPRAIAVHYDSGYNSFCNAIILSCVFPFRRFPFCRFPLRCFPLSRGRVRG